MQEKAQALLEALPYIQEFHGEIIIIKLGGKILESEKLLQHVLQDVVLLHLLGMKIVLVHGGGHEISEEMRKAGIKPKFVEGLRVTDEQTMEILYEQLAGKLNKQIVLGINKIWFETRQRRKEEYPIGLAVGITGMDGALIKAKKLIYKTTTSKGKEIEIDLGLVGEVEKIDTELIRSLLRAGKIPVIAPIGVDSEGRSLNLNADTVAAELAISLKAKKLILLTDVTGVLRNPNDETSLISVLTVEEAQKLIKDGVVKKGMIPKLEACIKAIQGGVERCHILSGLIQHSILLEILTDKGVGTMIVGG
ncbi:MAG: acetylglutamate kinase [Candidatus Hadarchaeales archaeon]